MSDLRSDLERMTPLQRATYALKEMRARLDAVTRARSEPIAITGMSCRFPGAPDPQAFWELLHNGVDAITEVPPDRWNIEDYYHPDPKTPEKMNTRWGGFITDVDRFDASFFGISPREAAQMDPQQRLLLEVAWEALEDAGEVPERLSGSQTGAFIGISSNDYGRMHPELEHWDALAGTGNAACIAANRLSYVFGLRGPSLAVDTACSSALVAVHLACRSLWSGESDQALVGGVNVILMPAVTVSFSMGGFMSPDGRCRAFDSRANGYVRSEGCGVVVLKRLADALSSGDRIYALLRGSAMNNDGRSVGLTAPSGLAQQAVIRAALASANLEPSSISYVEAHGTGTDLGDPIELGALAAVHAGRPEHQPLIVGSVKTNIGHLEAASGIAGLIKTALALHKREIPPHLHLKALNPKLAASARGIVIPSAPRAWPGDNPQFAGVSAFGFGGTNAHVVLEEAPRPAALEAPSGAAHLLAISARTEPALRELVAAYCAALRTGREPLGDVCYTASMRRTHHEHRVAAVGRSAAALADSLEEWLRDARSAAVYAGPLRPLGERQVAFAFGGEHSQCAASASELLEREPAFRAVFEDCDAEWKRLCDGSLAEAVSIGARGGGLAPGVAAPLGFAFQLGLVALYRSWGIEPAVVVGHREGEPAAAHVAGMISMRDAMQLFARCRELMIAGDAGAATGRLSAEAQRRLKLASREIQPRDGLVPVLSSAGVELSGEALDLTRWTRWPSEAPNLADLAAALARRECRSVIEIGPRPQLTEDPRALAWTAEPARAPLPSPLADTDIAALLRTTIARLYARGSEIAWQGVCRAGRTVALPAYPWQRARHWVASSWREPRPAASSPAAAPSPAAAAAIREANPRPVAQPQRTVIESLGVYLPPDAVSTDDVLRGCRNELNFPLEGLTGIRLRHVAGSGESSIELAAHAITRCLSRSRHHPLDIDLVICCNISRFDARDSVTFEPSTSVRLRERFRFDNALVFDIGNACAGVFTAILHVDAWIRAGVVRRAMIVSGECITPLMRTAQQEIADFMDPRLACLTLGDAGIALVLEGSDDSSVGFQSIELYTMARHASLCIAKASDRPPGCPIMLTDAVQLTSAGARSSVAHSVHVLAREGWPPETFSYLIMHQTSETAVRDAIRQINKHYGRPVCNDDNTIINLRERGNTATTTHFVALEDQLQHGRPRAGERMLFGITGSGLTIGTAVYDFDDLQHRMASARTAPAAPAAEQRPVSPRVARRQRARIESVGALPLTGSPGHSALNMAVTAARRCLERSRYATGDIDLLIYTGVYRDEFLCEPAMAALVANELEMNADAGPADKKTLAFDVLNGGLGFLNACWAASEMLLARRFGNALVVAAEIENNRAVRPQALLGLCETASSIVLDVDEEGASGFGRFLFHYETDKLGAFASRSCLGPALEFERSPELADAYLVAISAAVRELLALEGIRSRDVAAVLPPQISPGFVTALADRLGIDRERCVAVNADGDLFTSSLPYALDEARRRRCMTPGQPVLIIAVGAGIQVGCALYYA
jgi:acyl transferase domain-containing protein/3-hydroxy-3-methylglutaryl CoA synthase